MLTSHYKSQLVKRMNYLTGHLKAVKTMIEEDRYCIDIIRQNQAVMAALAKVNEIILKTHLDTCVAKAVESKDKGERRKVFGEIIEVYKQRGNQPES